MVAVVAHEVGHYKRGHIVKGLGLAQTGVVFWLFSLCQQGPVRVDSRAVGGLGGVGGDFSWEEWFACRRGASGAADVGGVEGLLDLSRQASDPALPRRRAAASARVKAGGGDKPRSLSGGELQLLLGRRACG